VMEKAAPHDQSVTPSLPGSRIVAMCTRSWRIALGHEQDSRVLSTRRILALCDRILFGNENGCFGSAFLIANFLSCSFFLVLGLSQPFSRTTAEGRVYWARSKEERGSRSIRALLRCLSLLFLFLFNPLAPLSRGGGQHSTQPSHSPRLDKATGAGS